MKKYLVAGWFISSLLSPLLAQAQCGCVTKKSSPKMYVDLGLGQALTYRSGSDSFNDVVDPEGGGLGFVLQPKNHGNPQNFTIGVGWLWAQNYFYNKPYFPFISLGLHSQHSNLNNTTQLMELFFFSEGDFVGSPTRITTPYIFSQDSLMANVKVDIYRWKYVMPYVNIGLGNSWNKTRQKEPFSETLPTEYDEILTPVARTNAFSYSVGAGLDFPITEKFWLGLGYAYTDFGCVETGKLFIVANGEPVSYYNENTRSFHLGRLTTQTILLTGRYLFG